MKKMVLTVLFLAVVFIPLSVGAQNMPMGKWWKDPKVVEDLKLTESQVSRLDEAFKNSRRKLIQLKSDVETQRFELDTLLDSDKLDQVKIDTRHKKLQDAQQALGTERFQFILEVRKIVGPEKFNQVKAMMMKSRRGRPGKDHMSPGK